LLAVNDLLASSIAAFTSGGAVFFKPAPPLFTGLLLLVDWLELSVDDELAFSSVPLPVLASMALLTALLAFSFSFFNSWALVVVGKDKTNPSASKKIILFIG
jgi:hypothetical protein